MCTPNFSEDGTWSVPLDLTAGTWRVFADFFPADDDVTGQTLTLGTDIAVAGEYTPAEIPAISRTAKSMVEPWLRMGTCFPVGSPSQRFRSAAAVNP